MSGIENVPDTTPDSGNVGPDPVEGFMAILDAEAGEAGIEDNQGELQSATGEELVDGGEPEPIDGQEVEPATAEAEEQQQAAEDEPGKSDQGQEDETPVYTVKVNGEDVEVSHDELVKGYQREADYTRKTQELGEQRREFEAHSQAVLQERQQYTHLLGALQQALESAQGPEPDWAKLAQEDPVGYTQQRAAWDQRQGQIQAARQEQERVANVHREEQARQIQAHMVEQRNLLIAAKPELADPTKAASFRTELMGYAQNQYGLSPQDLSGIMDHRGMLILEKAMKFDSMMAKGQGVQAKARTPDSPVVKPGVKAKTVPAKQRKFVEARKRLEKSGSTQDAAAAFESLL